MKTLAKHEDEILAAARNRAEALNKQQEREDDAILYQAKFDRMVRRLAHLENVFSAFDHARAQPTFQHLVRELEFRLAQGVAGPLAEKAIEVARDLLEGVQITSDFRHDEGSSTVSCDLVIAFMHPKEYRITRKIETKPRRGF